MWKKMRADGCLGENSDSIENTFDVNLLNEFFVQLPSSLGPRPVDLTGYLGQRHSFSIKCVFDSEVIRAFLN